jgi:hypothetical protein
VGSAAFKAVGTGTPRPAGSIPVHLRARGEVGQAQPGGSFDVPFRQSKISMKFSGVPLLPTPFVL